jgi:D-beta-D-heptose 7-phosphate kinase/D-beta-D-heptose 1-phosphate adenosyltransferase
MSHALSQIIDEFRGLDVLVIGEAMLDSYLEGTTERLCREAPVPIVAVGGRRDAPGGAANAAVNAAALGARARFLSVVGDDAEARLLRQALARHGVDTDDLLIDPSRRTLSKTRVVASGQLLVRFDQGSTGAVGEGVERELLGRLRSLFRKCDVIIVSDYGYGILAPAVIEALAGLQGRSPRVIVADSKDLAAYRDVGPTAVKPNYGEAVRLVAGRCDDLAGSRAERIIGWGECFLDVTGARMAAVTLDAEGAVVLERGRPPYRTYARPTDHAHAAGAGDTFLATLALALAAGAEAPAAADLASAASAVVVSREGTVACTAADLRGQFDLGGKTAAGLDDLLRCVDAHRRAGRRVVFTNGCFDIIHRGHTSYLSRAKALGDVLVVGVNSDASIRRLKGPTRPINAEDDRVEVLAALSCVDHLILFDEDTPCDLVGALRPDVFAKGGDYTLDRLPEASVVASYGGEVRILPYEADRSTTGLIAKIRAAHGEAGRPVAAPIAGGARG